MSLGGFKRSALRKLWRQRVLDNVVAWTERDRSLPIFKFFSFFSLKQIHARFVNSSNEEISNPIESKTPQIRNDDSGDTNLTFSFENNH